MNVLDENIPDSQRTHLQDAGIHVRQIGHDLGREGLKDDAIRSLLSRLRRATFFTRDADFYERRFCHRNYCLVWLDIRQRDVAAIIRRFLRHPMFRTQTQRMGTVINAHYLGLKLSRLHGEQEERLDWQ